MNSYKYKHSQFNKFFTIETELYSLRKKNVILENINKLLFFQASPEMRKFFILDSIHSNDKITQNKLAKKAKIVPAMVNKYINIFKNQGLLYTKGSHHRNTKYYLTDKGDNIHKRYTFEYIKEILFLYKEIKEEIKYKLMNLFTKNEKILLYGAGEITELIVQCESDINLNLVGVVDSDNNKIGTKLNGFIIEDSKELNNIDCDIVLITSLSQQDSIYKSIDYLKDKNIKVLLFSRL